MGGKLYGKSGKNPALVGFSSYIFMYELDGYNAHVLSRLKGMKTNSGLPEKKSVTLRYNALYQYPLNITPLCSYAFLFEGNRKLH